MPPVRASTRAYLRKFLWLGEAAKGRRVTKAEATFDEDTTKGNDHEALEGPMTRDILKGSNTVMRTQLRTRTMKHLKDP